MPPDRPLVLMALVLPLAITNACTPSSGGDARPKAERPAVLESDVAVAAPAGPLQGNWRVTRQVDTAKAAIMLIQLRHDSDRLEGDYVLFQPFCGLDRPAFQAGNETCEFDGVSADLVGYVAEGTMTLRFAPGADGLDHRLVVRVASSSDSLEGSYLAPGAAEGLPIRLTLISD